MITQHNIWPSKQGWNAHRRLVAAMAALCLAGLGTGCSDPEAEAPEAATPQPTMLTLDVHPAVQQAPPPGAPVPITEDPQEAADPAGPKQPPLNAESLAALNEAVSYYGLDEEGRKVRIPADVDQLVREKFLLVPPVAPKGTKLVINQKTGLIEIVAAR